MKKIILLAVAVGVLSLSAAVIERSVVRQMWPWNGSIMVEYKIAGVTAPVDVKVMLSAGGNPIQLAESAFGGSRLGIAENGVYSLTITPSAAEMPKKIEDLTVKLEPVAASAVESEAIYRIYDLDTGDCETITVGDIVSGRRGSWHWANAEKPIITPGVSVAAAATNIVWTGFNSDDTYRTSKLVMRRIPAGKVNILNRSDMNGTIPNPFWIAVYETTQAQWQKVYGSSPKFGYVGECNPASNIKYDEVRGAKGEEGNEAKYYWPNDPDPDSFLGKLRTLTKGEKFDLPWQAIWEYACQINSGWSRMNDRVVVGTYNTNVPLGTENGAFAREKDGKIVGWTSDPNFPGTYSGDGIGKYVAVGSYAPSVMGLYDMHGNVCEMCVDWSNAYVRQSDQTSLKGLANVDLEHPELMKAWDTAKTSDSTGTTRHTAGSAYSTGLDSQTPNYTRAIRATPSVGSTALGFRVIIVEQ